MQIEGAKCEFAEMPRKQEQRGLRDCGDWWPCSVWSGTYCTADAELWALGLRSCHSVCVSAGLRALRPEMGEQQLCLMAFLLRDASVRGSAWRG